MYRLCEIILYFLFKNWPVKIRKELAWYLRLQALHHHPFWFSELRFSELIFKCIHIEYNSLTVLLFCILFRFQGCRDYAYYFKDLFLTIKLYLKYSSFSTPLYYKVIGLYTKMLCCDSLNICKKIHFLTPLKANNN